MRLASGGLLACLACTTGDPARLEVERDTLALLGGEYTWLAINRVEDGRTIPALKARLIPENGSIVETSANAVACQREGVTRIQVALEELTTMFVVTCRFAERIDAPSYIELEPGDAPSSLAARAHFSSGRPEVLRPISATSSDSTVAVVRDGAVVPLSIGHAGLHIDYGGIRVRTAILIHRRIVDDTVAMASGETRAWRLDPGRYRLTVKVIVSRDLTILNMETTGLRCSRDSRDEHTIHCVADEVAEVSLRNTSGGKTARTARALVSLVAVP